MYVQAGTRNRTLNLHGLNSVILMLIYIYYTAEQGPNFMYGQSILSGLPVVDNLVSCYPFIGSPDIRIKKKQVILVDKGVEMLPPPQSSDSEEEVTKYTPIQKLGELFGTTLVQKLLQMLKKKVKEFKTRLLYKPRGFILSSV